MKRTLVISAAALLVFSSLAGPAGAAKKKPKGAKPVPVTLYAHGPSAIGNTDQAPVVGTGYMDLDTVEPTESSSKSFVFWGAATSPNPDCAGNSLLPVFVGAFQGRVVGDMKFTFTAESTPGELEIRVFPDVAAQACNESYIQPIRSVRVDASSGEAILSGPDFDVQGVLMVQVNPGYDTPTLTRFLYDSTADPTNLSLNCIPPKGAKSCV